MGGKAAKGPRLVGAEVELRPHAVHGVDHAAELGDEERGHHAARGQRKADRRAGRDDQSIDARDMLVGVDEQPFPVERHDLNVERLFLRHKRPRRIKVMRADPGHAAEQHDGQQRNRPDDQFELAGIFRIRQIARPGVGGAEPPGGARVATIVGTTIASMMATESTRSVRCRRRSGLSDRARPSRSRQGAARPPMAPTSKQVFEPRP